MLAFVFSSGIICFLLPLHSLFALCCFLFSVRMGPAATLASLRAHALTVCTLRDAARCLFWCGVRQHPPARLLCRRRVGWAARAGFWPRPLNACPALAPTRSPACAVMHWQPHISAALSPHTVLTPTDTPTNLAATRLTPFASRFQNLNFTRSKRKNKTIT